MKSFLALFLIGFSYSLYHCVGMCGGFVAAYSATASIGENPSRNRGQWKMHLLFNLGRVVSYSIIGAALGLAGSWVNYFGKLSGTRFQAVAGLIGGVVMILFAISLVGFLRLPSGALLGGGSVRRLFNTILRSRSPWRTFPLGMLVGTVPCGLVYSMSSYALSSGSALRGALDMASFGFGTIPAMFCFGFVSTALSARVRKGMLSFAVLLTIVMGVEAIWRSWKVL